MKNKSFLFPGDNISIPIKKGHKRVKSNDLMSYRHLNLEQNLEDVQAIDPINEHKEENTISKIISFNKDKSNTIINNNRKKSYKTKKTNKYNNLSKYKYNKFNKINSNSGIVKNKQKIKNIKINNLFLVLNENKIKHKKNNSCNIPSIKYNDRKNKTKTHSHSPKVNKINFNDNSNSKLIPYNNKININKEIINYKKKAKFKINKKKITDAISKKENINTINISNSSRQNSFSTDINSSSCNRYSPCMTFGNKASPKLHKIKYKNIPKQYVYVKKINKNNKIYNYKKDYNQFKKDLNKIRIDELDDNYIESENDVDEKIEKKSIIYNYNVEKFKTFEEIQRKNLNMAIIKKIINNNNINIQTYNINSLRNNGNNSLLYNRNEELNNNNLKTATFAILENEK